MPSTPPACGADAASPTSLQPLPRPFTYRDAAAIAQDITGSNRLVKR